MKRHLFFALALVGCVTSNSTDSAANQLDGAYSNSNGTLLVTLSSSRFDLKCFPKTSADIDKFQTTVAIEIKGATTTLFDTLYSPSRIDTVLQMDPDEFYRINADNSTTKLDSLSLGSKNFRSSKLLLNLRGDSSGSFTNYFGLETVTRTR